MREESVPQNIQAGTNVFSLFFSVTVGFERKIPQSVNVQHKILLI